MQQTSCIATAMKCVTLNAMRLGIIQKPEEQMPPSYFFWSINWLMCTATTLYGHGGTNRHGRISLGGSGTDPAGNLRGSKLTIWPIELEDDQIELPCAQMSSTTANRARPAQNRARRRPIRAHPIRFAHKVSCSNRVTPAQNWQSYCAA
jgi:hypothetical protein